MKVKAKMRYQKIAQGTTGKFFQVYDTIKKDFVAAYLNEDIANILCEALEKNVNKNAHTTKKTR